MYVYIIYTYIHICVKVYMLMTMHVCHVCMCTYITLYINTYVKVYQLMRMYVCT